MIAFLRHPFQDGETREAVCLAGRVFHVHFVCSEKFENCKFIYTFVSDLYPFVRERV